MRTLERQPDAALLNVADENENRIIGSARENPALEIIVRDFKLIVIYRRRNVKLTAIIGYCAFAETFNRDIEFAEILIRAHRRIIGVGAVVVDVLREVLVARPKRIDIELEPEIFSSSVDHAPEPSVAERIPGILPASSGLIVPDHVFGAEGENAPKSEYGGKCFAHLNSSLFYGISIPNPSAIVNLMHPAGTAVAFS